MQKSYREYTSKLLDSLKNQKDTFLKVKSTTERVEDMIIQLFDNEPNINKYASYIDYNSALRGVFTEFRIIRKNITQSAFEEKVETVKKELDACFEKIQAQSQYQSKKGGPIPSNYTHNSIYAIQPKPIIQLSIEKGVIQKQKDEAQPQAKTVDIEYEKIQVEIRYLQTAVDLEDYVYNGFELKQSLNGFVVENLQKEVKVLAKLPEVRIMNEITIIKSEEAGNYRFNPFCDVVEIFAKTKDNTNFEYNFKITGQVKNIKITYKPIGALNWNQNLMKLSPKSSVELLAQEICNKRQEPHFAKDIGQALRKKGGANIIQDLFRWEKSDYSSLNMKTTYIFEIQELIMQIKSSTQVGKERSLKKQKQQCIRISNSHKILRYCVYNSSKGHEKIQQIAWLNMKNLRKAIEIVKNEIFNEELMNQLNEYFSQFALDPDGKPISYSRGLILYGPPGTGKTVLTEALPNIIGFHLIEKGLSAADFMKSLVGESSRMVRDLVNRAAISPYLLCSVGIDEVDGLVPDRKDKDEKNKGEGISMLLSVIGGNKDVSNLVFMTSTNYLKKIDQAIRRRLSGQYQVGRPNPWARAKIIQKKCDYLEQKPDLLNHLINITTNFTGAAISSLMDLLLKSLNEKQMDKKPIELTTKEIDEFATLIARQFNIKLGVYTLPEIYSNKQDKKFMFSGSFLQKISNHFMLVKLIGDSEFSIMYATETHRYSQAEGKVTTFYEREEDKVNIPTKNNEFECFVNYIKTIFPETKYNHSVIRGWDYGEHKKYLKAISDFVAPTIEKQQKQSQIQFSKRLKIFQSMKKRKKIIIVTDFKGLDGDLEKDAKIFSKNLKNIFIFYYLNYNCDLRKIAADKFREWKPEEQDIRQENYSGRIMVELNNQTRMAFELNSSMESESKVAFKLFLRSNQNASHKAIIPELVDFFTKQKVSYILVIDYELLLQNDAFEEKKILEVMEERMMQAKNYQKSAVIINLDSVVMLNQNVSVSNLGRSLSYSIQNHNIYQILKNYMLGFAMVSEKVSRWMTVIVEHPELISMVKRDLKWPSYPEEIEKQLEEQAKDMEKQCVRCGVIYKQRNNQDRQCLQHPGLLIDTVLKIFNRSSPEELRAKRHKLKKLKPDDRAIEEDRYLYACCQKGLNDQGCQSFYHLQNEELHSTKDELYHKQINQNDRWQQVRRYFE